jgi:hypothetical protein
MSISDTIININEIEMIWLMGQINDLINIEENRTYFQAHRLETKNRNLPNSQSDSEQRDVNKVFTLERGYEAKQHWQLVNSPQTRSTLPFSKLDYYQTNINPSEYT